MSVPPIAANNTGRAADLGPRGAARATTCGASRNAPAPRRAFTLAELLVAVAVATILLSALASAVLLTTKALPERGGDAERVGAAGDALDQLVEELQYAQYITERSATAVAFTVADRDGDRSPERIRYVWSGVSGAPLTRQYNGGTAVGVLDDVQQFALTYDVKTLSEQYTGLPVEGSEVLLNSCAVALSPKDYNISKDNWAGQFFKPSAGVVPSAALTWRLTRLWFRARSDGPTDGVVRVQVRRPNANNTPSTTVLEERLVNESSLPSSATWLEFPFSSVSGLGPNDGVCLVLQHGSGGGNSATVRFEDNIGAGRVTTSNAGSTWTYDTGKSLYYYAYGRFTTVGPLQTAVRRYVTGVRVALRYGADATARLDAAARCLNSPEVLAAVWEPDFSDNPTLLDTNGDGLADWGVVGGQPFNMARLVQGVWRADQRIAAAPRHTFTGLTTVVARFRDVTAGGPGAVVRLPVDFGGGMCGVIQATVTQGGSGTQALAVSTVQEGGGLATLATASQLPLNFVRLRLLIDPVLDSVNVQVNGADYGTFAYQRFSSGADGAVELYPENTETGAEFDSVSVRVGGNP